MNTEDEVIVILFFLKAVRYTNQKIKSTLCEIYAVCRKEYDHESQQNETICHKQHFFYPFFFFLAVVVKVSHCSLKKMYECILLPTAFQSTINCNPLFGAVILNIIDPFPYIHDTAGPKTLFTFRHLLN